MCLESHADGLRPLCIQAYTLKGSFGSKSAQFIESNAEHARSAHFGTDLRHTAELRENKARGQPVRMRSPAHLDAKLLQRHENFSVSNSPHAPVPRQVDKELEFVRHHSLFNTFKQGRQSHRIDSH